jgi:LytS/YehU family sensor histidine kinase
LHAEPGREVTLESELDLVRQYVSIQQMRFSDRLTVTIDVAPDALSAQVPHLLLQPLVENAIRHGIAPREAPGHVRIPAGRSGDRLCLQVEDDGLGLGETRPSTAGAGLGLSATEARLRHLYGGGASLKVASRAPTGVIATIDLPFHTTPAEPAPAAAGV